MSMSSLCWRCMLSRMKPFTQRYFSLSSRVSILANEALPESINKTTVEMASKENPKISMLTGYGIGVFKFNRVTIRGSVAIVDKTVFKWNVDEANSITTASLAMFSLVYPKLDVVVIGTGNEYTPVDPEVIKEMNSRGVSIEVQPTRQACGTYNLLRMERPSQVGVALIPISTSAGMLRIPSKGNRSAIED